MYKVNYSFIYNLSQNPNIWNGPALVGCLFTAARKKDVATIELIAQYFDSTWFTGPKYKDLTAYGLLAKNGLEREANLLMTFLGPQFTTQSVKDIQKELDGAESFESFKQLIEGNPQWLNKNFDAHQSLVMIFVTSLRFSVEKFEFLVREKGADIHMVNTKKETVLNFMLGEYNDISRAQRLVDLLQLEEIQDVLLTSPTFLSDLAKKTLKVTSPLRVLFQECFKSVVNLPRQTLETTFFPKNTGSLNKEWTSIFEVIHADSQLFAIAAERAFQLIGKEDNQMAALVHLLRVHARSIFTVKGPTYSENVNENKLLALFKFFFDKLHLTDKQKEAGYTSALEDWQDRYGMTFLMRLLGDNADSASDSNCGMHLLIKKIILGEFFDNEYITPKLILTLVPSLIFSTDWEKNQQTRRRILLFLKINSSK